MAEEQTEGDRMQTELDQLDQHIGEARKKAQKTREQSDLDDDELGGEVVGEWSDMDSSGDDPSGALDDESEPEQ